MNTKRYIFTLLFTLLAMATNAQSWSYYYYNGERIDLEIDRRYLNIVVESDFEKESVSDLNFASFELKKKTSTIKTDQWAKLRFITTPTQVEFKKKIDALKKVAGVK